jgi:transcriptional regulator with XRE-family HTH domain
VEKKRRTKDSRILRHLGANIQKERKRLNFTQEYVAEKLDIFLRAYQRIETGERGPSTTTLVRIQELLGCPWERLMAGLKYRSSD